MITQFLSSLNPKEFETHCVLMRGYACVRTAQSGHARNVLTFAREKSWSVEGRRPATQVYRKEGSGTIC